MCTIYREPFSNEGLFCSSIFNRKGCIVLLTSKASRLVFLWQGGGVRLYR